MLETVTVASGYPLTLNLTGVDPSEMFILKSISGLTSSKVGLQTGDFASEGSYYQGRRPEKLTPVLTLKLNPNYQDDVEMSDLRETLYRAFYEPSGAGQDGVELVFEDDRKPLRYIIGYTESIDTDQFSQSRDVQIAMQCMEAYLFSSDVTTASDATGWSSTPIDYDGSAKCGIEVNFKINTAGPSAYIDLGGSDYMKLNRAFTVGQTVYINTNKGQRAVRLGGIGGTDIMAALDPNSRWLQLKPGANTLRAYGAVPGDGKAVATSYTFRSQWWGL